MIRYLQLSLLGLCLLWASPTFGQAQTQPEAPPPPPPQDQPRDADAPRDRVQEQPRGPVDEGRRDRNRLEDELEHRQGEMDRQQMEHFARPPRYRFSRPEIPPNTAWLGIQLTPVPAALAHHLQLDDKGVMIANVFEGSPADKAGLDRYDIIIMADGKPTAGGMEAVPKFSEIVRDKRPGQPLELTIISRGREKALRVELGMTPSDWSRVRPKYEEDPDVALQREFGLRGRILRPGPGGDWIMEDLDRFPQFRDRLERELRKKSDRQQETDRPRDLDRPRDAEPPRDFDRRPAERDQQKRVEEARRVDKDGNTLQVQRDENGRITVRRYKSGADPDKVQVIYESMEQLRQADKEAYELLQSAIPRDSSARPTPPGRPGAPLLQPRSDRLRVAPPGPPLSPGRPTTRPFGGAVPRPRDRAEAWREWEQRFFRGPLQDLREPAALAPAPARTRFEVAPDGKISVHVREGDAEMTQTFNSREELRDKAPKLFEQYEELESRIKSRDGGGQRPENSQ